MSQYKLNQTPQTYFIPPVQSTTQSNVFYRQTDMPQYQYVNSNANKRVILSDSHSIKNPPLLISPQNSQADRPKPFLSPQKIFIEKSEPITENVDDIVSKCLSRTQKLIEGIKKVKKLEDSSIHPENENSMSVIKKEKNLSTSIIEKNIVTATAFPSINVLAPLSPLKQNVTLSSSPVRNLQISRTISSPNKSQKHLSLLHIE